mmetsp:Transcript_7725/g.14683  ORF Transcript_7725/g.14683 Transcript_7725/m.14683 type:complete len:206 (-) Transcript_7725:1137-1754(-)
MHSGESAVGRQVACTDHIHVEAFALFPRLFDPSRLHCCNPSSIIEVALIHQLQFLHWRRVCGPENLERQSRPDGRVQRQRLSKALRRVRLEALCNSLPLDWVRVHHAVVHLLVEDRVVSLVVVRHVKHVLDAPSVRLFNLAEVVGPVPLLDLVRAFGQLDDFKQDFVVPVRLSWNARQLRLLEPFRVASFSIEAALGEVRLPQHL